VREQQRKQASNGNRKVPGLVSHSPGVKAIGKPPLTHHFFFSVLRVLVACSSLFCVFLVLFGTLCSLAFS
jgi:hypothetical protein